MAALPAPHTNDQILLAALHEEIVGLRADLKAALRGGERAPAKKTVEPAAGQKVLEEPTAPVKPVKAPSKKASS